MATQLLGITGAIIGGAFYGPRGAQIGFAVGSIIGGIIDPPHIDGPKLGDAAIQTSRDGIPIPIIWGIHHVVGNIIQMNPIIETKKKIRQGKGGGTTTTETRRTRTFAIGIARGPDGPVAGFLRVWENNKLVYDARPVPTLPVADSIAFLASVNIYLGGEAQLPDPELEVETGVGTTPAYRGLAYMVFINKDITDFGSSIPSYRFETSCVPAVLLPFASDATAWWDLEESDTPFRPRYYSRSVDDNSLEFDTFNGMTKWTPGVVGDGIQLRASTSEYVRIEKKHPRLRCRMDNNPWSAVMWIETQATIDAGGYLINQWNSNPSSNTMGDRQWRLRINAAGNGFEFSIITGITSADTGVDLDTGDIGLATLTRYMLAIVHNPVTDLMSLYVNAGTPVTAAVVGGCTTSINALSQTIQIAQVMTLGTDSGTRAETKSNLDADLVSIWHISLTGLNIGALFNDNTGLAFDSLPGQVPYNPGMMMYNRTAFYETPLGQSISVTGSSVFVIAYFRTVEWTGDVEQYLYVMAGSTSKVRAKAIVHASDATIAETRNRVIVETENGAGTVICKLMSDVDVCDDQAHVIFYSFNGTTGAATFIIDGVNADDTGYTSRVAPTTGTLETGSTINNRWGASLADTLQWGGYLGFTGLKDIYRTNWSDFMTGNVPKRLDHIGWTEFGGEPHMFNDVGEASNNMTGFSNKWFEGASKLLIGPEQPPEWSYTTMVLAEASGDAWVDGDTIQIVSGDQQTAVLFLYQTKLLINDHNGLVHKYKFGTADDNPDKVAQSVRSVVSVLDTQPAGVDPDDWGWTDLGTGTQGTDYRHDLDAGKSRLINLTGSGAVDLKGARIITRDENTTMLVIDALEASTTLASGSAVEIWNIAGEQDNVVDNVRRGALRIDKSVSATNWLVVDQAGVGRDTGIPFGTPTRIWIYVDAVIRRTAIWTDTSTKPEDQVREPEQVSSATEAIRIKHTTGNDSTTKLGYFLQAQLRMRT